MDPVSHQYAPDELSAVTDDGHAGQAVGLFELGRRDDVIELLKFPVRPQAVTDMVRAYGQACCPGGYGRTVNVMAVLRQEYASDGSFHGTGLQRVPSQTVTKVIRK